MSEHDPSPGGAAPASDGLLRSLRSRLAAYLGPLQTRLQLLAVELHEEKLRLAEIGVFAAVAGFFLALSVIVFTFFVIVVFWDSHRVLVTGLVAAAYLVIGVVCALAARSRARAPSRLFKESIAELAKDRERLEKR